MSSDINDTILGLTNTAIVAGLGLGVMKMTSNLISNTTKPKKSKKLKKKQSMDPSWNF